MKVNLSTEHFLNGEFLQRDQVLITRATSHRIGDTIIFFLFIVSKKKKKKKRGGRRREGGGKKLG